jgi:DeoR family glycerol-3-phosphate regulon repressor
MLSHVPLRNNHHARPFSRSGPILPEQCVTQSDRIKTLVAMLEERGACAIADLAAHFGVSEETVRRDVRQLEEAGRAFKVHGGVRLPDNQLEAPYRLRMREQSEAKHAIARRAARLVKDGMTVLIDSGTTSFHVARELAPLRRLTIITNNLAVASELLGRNDHRIFLAGGAVNIDYRATFDAEAIAYTRRFVPDIAVLSMGAIEAARGFLDFEPEEANYKRAVLDRARRVVVVADAVKFTRSGSVHVAEFDDVHDIVTDAPPPPEVAAAAARRGTRLDVVGPAAPGR